MGIRGVNDSAGVLGRPLELVVRDTSADPQRAAAAVDEPACSGVFAVAGASSSLLNSGYPERS